MNKTFADIFVSPDDQRPLVYKGKTIDGNWTEGLLVDSAGTKKYIVRNGIPSFVTPQQDSWGSVSAVDQELERLGGKREGLIRKNVEEMLAGWNHAHKRYPWIKRIASRGGLILEIACGWGGGNVPMIMDLDPSATVLMNDLGVVLLEEWRNYLWDNRKWSNVGLAHFDATQCPVRSNTFDSVDSAGGIANIGASHKAISEAYRVLKPGGNLFMSDIDVDPECYNRLPARVREQWQCEHDDPDIGTGYERRLRKVGFKINSTECSRYILDPQESTLAELGAKHGIKMDVIGYQIEAEKE